MNVLFFAVCGPKFTKFGTHVGENCSFQRSFPIDDILFSSGDIRDQIAKSKILMFLGRQIFLGRDPQISDSILKITVTTEHVAKFGDDRPRDLRD